MKRLKKLVVMFISHFNFIQQILVSNVDNIKVALIMKEIK